VPLVLILNQAVTTRKPTHFFTPRSRGLSPALPGLMVRDVPKAVAIAVSR